MSEDKSSQVADSEGNIRYVNLYEPEDKIYTRYISGFFSRIRKYTGIPLLAGFVLLPWLSIDDRPAMLFDLPARKFYIMWMTFWPQDAMLLSWLLIICAFALFTVTVLLGRVWCGFTCPQTVWTLMFMWAERQCEGDRNRRIKLDKQPWSTEKILRKGTKHFLWVLIALATSLTFVGYFYPIRELIVDLATWQAPFVAVVWVFIFTFMTYMNAGWLREQVCKYMCPYARFQSVMYDNETLAVHYDPNRGEQRGPRKVGDKPPGMGDCIDCHWCVQVCPVDIDIRDGLQYECINCGLCVDACNQVMEKMSYPKGLIRFTTADELKTGKLKIFRPRLFGYAAAVTIMVSLFISAVSTREPLNVEIFRDRGANMYRVVSGQVQNVYTVKINNMTEEEQLYTMTVSGPYGGYKLRGGKKILLDPGEVFTLPVRVSLPKEELKETQHDITLRVEDLDDAEVYSQQKVSFIGPQVESK